MTDDTVRLALVGQVLKRRWRLLAALAVLGAAVGAGASVFFSPGYQTTSNVLLQGPRQADELLTQAEVAISSVVLDRAAAALPWHPSGADLKKQVDASATNGNVLTITASAGTAEQAQQLADQVAQQYVKYSGQLATNSGDSSAQLAGEQQEALRQQVKLATEKIEELAKGMDGGLTVESVQARTQLEGLRASLDSAVKTLGEAEATASRNNAVAMGNAPLPPGRATPTPTHFIAGGAVLFLIAGIFGHLVAFRRDRRLRNQDEIASALGTRALGVLDVELAPPSGPKAKGALGTLRWLVGADRPWYQPPVAVPGSDAQRDLRYRRVLDHLDAGARGVLLLVPEDDASAGKAAERLAEFAQRTAVAARVCLVSPERPLVPDGHDVAVVMSSPGTRIAWELAELAAACAESGREIAGVVVTAPVQPSGRASSSTAGAPGEALAGRP
ncbi:exopolysaccharide biosynthesis protein [Amycolatopsis sp. MEPSY49]|uniref:exopolysaccharide biosynthesis protein n=1 Tax=Amycolatopsis sp. MEPSY49 TaxID=3151600 RepID=UPI003EFA4C30